MTWNRVSSPDFDLGVEEEELTPRGKTLNVDIEFRGILKQYYETFNRFLRSAMYFWEMNSHILERGWCAYLRLYKIQCSRTNGWNVTMISRCLISLPRETIHFVFRVNRNNLKVWDWFSSWYQGQSRISCAFWLVVSIIRC